MKRFIITSDGFTTSSDTGSPNPTNIEKCKTCDKYSKNETGLPESFYYYNGHILEIREKIARVTSDVSHISDRIAAIENRKNKNEFSRPEKITVFVAILQLLFLLRV